LALTTRGQSSLIVADEAILIATRAHRLLRCMSPLMAQSGQVATSAVCPLLGRSGHARSCGYDRIGREWPKADI